MKKINVLSLFDGMSCAQIALERAGIEVDKYYASEVDKYAIAVTQHNYPNTIQLGDITKWREWDIDWAGIDLLIGGSPCQGLSHSGRGEGLKDERSALFFDYVDILEHIKKHNPNVIFILENVVPQKKEWAQNMSSVIGVDFIEINSALVSAQSRRRLYWTNIGGIEQPKDKNVYLQDVIESGWVDSMKSYCINANYFTGTGLKEYFEKSRRQLVFDVPVQVGHINQNHRGSRYYAINGKSVTLCASGGGWGMKTGLYIVPKSNSGTLEPVDWETTSKSQRKTIVSNMIDNGDAVIRRLTPTECETLQTVPQNFTLAPHPVYKNKMMSNTQRYKMLGNGFTVDVIAHILSYANFG
jgi:DNA (cytosine-5)-methyltransferase 1